MYFNFSEDLLLNLLNTYSHLLSKEDKKYIQHIILFLLRIFNQRIAFKLEIGNCLRIGLAYKSNLPNLLAECCSMNINMQANFWILHDIITEK